MPEAAEAVAIPLPESVVAQAVVAQVAQQIRA
jgi:hypothetical protein